MGVSADVGISPPNVNKEISVFYGIGQSSAALCVEIKAVGVALVYVQAPPPQAPGSGFKPRHDRQKLPQ